MISVILPTKDEPGLQRLADEIHDVLSGMKHEIIVVDKSKAPPKVKGAKVFVQEGDGLGAAVVQGMKHAQGKVFVVMDADFSHNPKDIRRLLDHIENYDIVVGSRYEKGGFNDDNFMNVTISRVCCFFASKFLGLKTKDCLSGFAAIKREVHDAIELNPIGFKVNMEMLYKAKHKGFTATEVPIRFLPRRIGKSKRGFASMREIARGAKYILRLKLRKS